MRPRALLVSAALLLGPPSALAQSAAPSLDLRGFHASSDPQAGVYLEPASTPATFEWSTGLWTSYAYRPVTLRDHRTGAISSNVIAHQITTDVVASIGFARRFSIGLDLPALLYQVGDARDALTARLLGPGPLPAQALGDLGIDGKLTLLQPTAGDAGGLAFAVFERFTLPTGDEASYLGEGSIASETRALVEYRLTAIGVHVTTGIRLRGHAERFACSDAATEPACPSRFGHEMPFGFGFTLKPQLAGGRATIYFETHGHLPIAPIAPFQSASAASLQASVGARYALGDLSLFAGLETALVAGVGDSAIRGALQVSWAPREHDADGDGIDDDLDQCIDLPEDHDGFQDDDGCPDADNDDDGVLDASDRCPVAKEDRDGFQDDDGCPDPDNDGDGIPDSDDACPMEAGKSSPDPKLRGCPIGPMLPAALPTPEKREAAPQAEQVPSAVSPSKH
jgi:OmpA-OmpF porin, OOP family